MKNLKTSKEYGDIRFFVKLMPNGSIVYDSILYKFFYLNQKQTEQFNQKNKNKTIKPIVYNPFWLCFFDLSYKCNLKCEHCHNNYGKVNELTLEQKMNTLDQIFDLGLLHVSFGGGELLLYENLFDILKYTSERTTCSFVTNGILIDKNICKKLKGLVSYVGVSLDGFKETHAKMRNADIFDKAVEGIRMLIKYKIPVRVTSCPTKINYTELPKLGNFILNELGATWKLMKYIPEGGKRLDLALTQKEENWLYREASKLGKERTDYYFRIKCPAGKSVFSIYANGDVSPCGFAPFLTSGNVLKEPLIDILKNGKFFRLMRIVKSNKCVSAEYWRNSEEFNFNISL
jgi:MoaA/NifB/PqqE/SkfB family radical SAM enzyme